MWFCLRGLIGAGLFDKPRSGQYVILGQLVQHSVCAFGQSLTVAHMGSFTHLVECSVFSSLRISVLIKDTV